MAQGMSQLELEDEVQDDLKRATGEFTKDGDDANKLNRILQLTGFSDPVYAEAYVTVHHYDIVLDVTVINRTKETLQNLCLELATMGDLKLVERPQNYILAPESSRQIRANIKVSSTETGVIFGNIVYETSNVLERNVVVLNDIHIDIMDYISPATCADVAFRNMWAEFEWENKVTSLSPSFSLSYFSLPYSLSSSFIYLVSSGGWVSGGGEHDHPRREAVPGAHHQIDQHEVPDPAVISLSLSLSLCFSLSR